MERNRPHYDSTYSYFPEVFSRYGHTVFTNQNGPPLQWRPCFTSNGKCIALAAITVRGGETKRATLA
jgi:hypothetical protein